MINGISIRAPTRGATLHKVLNPQGMKFQSALPRGERRSEIVIQSDNRKFQSALPRGERRRTALRRSVRSCISIRAPTRGATMGAGHWSLIPLFQSALPRGERRRRHTASGCTILFQSALPRGERRLEPWKRNLPSVFQSALPRGERLVIGSVLGGNTLFQSALPRGERQVSIYQDYLIYCNFNPRSHEGSDPLCCSLDFEIQISIRAPTRGATCSTNTIE